MKTYRFNYIITIHNKQTLIEDVFKGVLAACDQNSFIYPVLDGCTDSTEEIIDGISKKTRIPIIKLYASDVHEILSLNTGLRAASQQGYGFNILLQDDVILNEPHLQRDVIKIYECIGYHKIGVLAFRHGVNIVLDDKTKEVKEKDLIESYYGNGLSKNVLAPNHIVSRMVGVRSPECISFEMIRSIGFFDEQLAPYTYDNHDFSLRCLKAGFENYVYALNFKSDVKWGGMRQNPHEGARAIMARNRKYLYNKYKDFLKLNEIKKIQRSRPKSFLIPGIEPAECLLNLGANSTTSRVKKFFVKIKESLFINNH